jgi:hypothetical protein
VREDVLRFLGVSMKLIGTRLRASLASANRSAAKACELREITATRSPTSIPCAANPVANWSTMSSNSAYVQSVLPQRMASLFGNRSRVLRNRSPKVWREISVFMMALLGFLNGH